MKKIIFGLMFILLAISICAEAQFPGPPSGDDETPSDCDDDSDCIDYCSGDTRYYSGDCLGVGCSYQTETCEFGCDASTATCNSNPDDGDDDQQQPDNQGLIITSVDVSESNLEPGEETKVTVKVRNDAGEEVDANLKVWFEYNNRALEDDKGKDIEDDDSFDLNDGRTKTSTFRFDMPYDVDDDDSYNVMVEVNAKGKDTGEEYSDSDNSKKISFDKESHELLIENFDSWPSSLSCSNNLELSYKIRNVGKDDEEVKVKITSSDLDIDYEEDVEIDENDAYRNSIKLKPELTEGTHNINLKIEYSGKTEIESVQLPIRDCSRSSQKEDDSDDEDEEEEEVKKKSIKKKVTQDEDSVTTTIYTPVQPTVKPEMRATAAKVVKSNNMEFTETEEYFMLIIILFILLLGLVIYAIGATVIILRR